MQYHNVPWPFPSGGLYMELGADFVPPPYLTQCTNLYYQRPTLLRSRGSFNLLYSGGAGTNVHVLYKWDRDGKLYHADDAATLYANGVSVGSIDGNVTDIESFGVAGNPKLYVCEEKGARDHTLHVWDTSTYSAVTGTAVPSPTLLMSRDGRLFATGDSDYPSRIFWSSPGDPTVWAGAYEEGGWLDIKPGEDGGIRDWIDFRGALYIFKRGGVYRVSGDQPSSYYVERMGDVVEMQANTVADVHKGVLYITKHSVFPLGTTPVGEVDSLTGSVESDIAPSLEGASAAYSPEMNAYIIVDGSSTAWVSNTANRPDVWTTFSLPCNATCIYNGDTLYVGDDDGDVYQYSHTGYEDDGSPFTVKLKSCNWNMGDELHLKNVRFIEGVFNGTTHGDATVNLYADSAASADATEVFTSDDKFLMRVNLNCGRLAYEVSYSSMDGPCLFGGIALQTIEKAPVQ